MTRAFAALFLVSLLLVPSPARGDDELADYLESAMEADFHGEGVVMSRWGDDSAATTYRVTRSDGMSMVSSAGGHLMVSGALSASQHGADWYALEVDEWTAWSLSDRYSLGESVAVTRLGRPATEIVVMEGGKARARLVIDAESTVPLLTEILDGDGAVFRSAAMVDFAPGPTSGLVMPEEFMERKMLDHSAFSPDLPEEVFGYSRKDTYLAPGAGTQSFYTDGLFSFSLFEAGRGVSLSGFGSPTPFEVAGDMYSRVVTPSIVWVHWSSPDHSYVLVGDLPPDHIEAVLAQLPRPGMRGVVTRLLMSLFDG